MPQYLVANYLPDDFDPSAVTEAMIEEIHALNRELMVRCSSPMCHTPRPRSIWAVSGYWKPPMWTRHSHGRERVPSPAIRRARCASFFSTRLRVKDPGESK